MIVLDTSVALALLNRRDDAHERASTWYAAVTDAVVTTPLVLAEIDHLTHTRGRPTMQRAFRSDLTAGAYGVEWWPGAAVECVQLAERYADLRPSLADASLVALAARLETEAIATLDERHFRAIMPLTGASAFRLLPADA